jgi:hypothetical protein
MLDRDSRAISRDIDLGFQFLCVFDSIFQRIQFLFWVAEPRGGTDAMNLPAKGLQDRLTQPVAITS